MIRYINKKIKFIKCIITSNNLYKIIKYLFNLIINYIKLWFTNPIVAIIMTTLYVAIYNIIIVLMNSKITLYSLNVFNLFSILSIFIICGIILLHKKLRKR